MKIVTNPKLINRNRKIGQFTSFGSMAILAVGLYFSFQSSQYAITISFAALILGFVLSQVGIYFGNRWGRSPRPDESLTAALKGLEEKYTLYHYVTAVSHLLVGPAGIWVILPYTMRGTISYDEKKKRWKQKGGNWYLKVFAQEGLGRPDLDVEAVCNDAKKYIARQTGKTELPPIQAILTFTNPKAEVEAANAPIPTLPADKIKDFFRKQAKESALPMETVRGIQDNLPKPDPR